MTEYTDYRIPILLVIPFCFILFWWAADNDYLRTTASSRQNHLNSLDLENSLKSDGSPENAALLAIFQLQKIPVNTAGPELLQTISGIGPKLAGKIVFERKANGPFTSPGDLARVPGIGPKRTYQFHHHLRFD